MTQVFFSTDTEIWCDGWQNIDRKFPEAFRRYVYGPTRRGDRGLGFILKVLNDHGLRSTFFVEPLFSLRFGPDPLAELVGLIHGAGQDVQLHLHTEWLDESRAEPLFPHIREKRQHLMYFNREEQTALIAEGKRLLEAAGAPMPVAFRAGSFAMNRDTLPALHANEIYLDSSYDPGGARTAERQIADERWLFQPFELDGVYEYPLSVYQDRPGNHRHAQLGACAASELIGLLDHAERTGWESVVILSHSSELVDYPTKTQADPTVERRFLRLCRFLEREHARLPATAFGDVKLPPKLAPQPPLYRSPSLRTGWRFFEQAMRRARYRLQSRNAVGLDAATGSTPT